MFSSKKPASFHYGDILGLDKKQLLSFIVSNYIHFLELKAIYEFYPGNPQGFKKAENNLRAN